MIASFWLTRVAMPTEIRDNNIIDLRQWFHITPEDFPRAREAVKLVLSE